MTDTQVSINTSKNQPRVKDPSKRPKFTSPEKVRHLIQDKGLTLQEAANILGISQPSVWSLCKTHHIMTKGQLALYRRQRADIMASKGQALLNSITPEEIKKIPPGQRAVTFGILYDKERLERGESTSNIAIGHVTRELREIDSERRKLESELADLAGDNDAIA